MTDQAKNVVQFTFYSLIFILHFIFSLSTYAQSIPNWEKLKWGMTPKEIFSLYPNKIGAEQDMITDKAINYFNKEFKLNFMFNESEKLYRLQHELLPLLSKKQLYGLKADYHELKVHFSELYGNPVKDEVETFNVKLSPGIKVANHNSIWNINDNLFVNLDYFTYQVSADLKLTTEDKQTLADTLYLSYDDPNHFLYLKKYLNRK